MLKMTLWPWPNIIFEKVKKLQNFSMILREMASNLLSHGHIRSPLPGLGLNMLSWAYNFLLVCIAVCTSRNRLLKLLDNKNFKDFMNKALSMILKNDFESTIWIQVIIPTCLLFNSSMHCMYRWCRARAYWQGFRPCFYIESTHAYSFGVYRKK